MTGPVIKRLPESAALTQASFGMVWQDRVETLRGGREEIFSHAPPRWAASYSLAPDHAQVPEIRAFVTSLWGAGGVAYIHDASDPKPMGGALTAKARAAAAPAGVTWEEAGPSVVTWEEAGPSVVTWQDLAPVPEVTSLRLAAPAAAGARTVAIEGLWPARANVILAGHYVQVGHWLYLAAEATDSTAAGRATVRLDRGLRVAEPIHRRVRLECAATLMRLDQGRSTWGRGPQARRWPTTLQFVEVMPGEWAGA